MIQISLPAIATIVQSGDNNLSTHSNNTKHCVIVIAYRYNYKHKHLSVKLLIILNTCLHLEITKILICTD